jgi:hypothetical protein
MNGMMVRLVDRVWIGRSCDRMSVTGTSSCGTCERSLIFT